MPNSFYERWMNRSVIASFISAYKTLSKNIVGKILSVEFEICCNTFNVDSKVYRNNCVVQEMPANRFVDLTNVKSTVYFKESTVKRNVFVRKKHSFSILCGIFGGRWTENAHGRLQMAAHTRHRLRFHQQ